MTRNIELTSEHNVFFAEEGSTENFIVKAGASNARIMTGFGDDLVEGDLGNDLIYSGGGSDIINGRRGNDIIIYGTADVPETQKNMIILQGDDGEDILCAIDAGLAFLAGDNGDDEMFSYAAYSRITGGDGNDRISAAGDSQVWGGDGIDQFDLLRNFIYGNRRGGDVSMEIMDFSPFQGEGIYLRGLTTDYRSSLTRENLSMGEDGSTLIVSHDGFVDTIRGLELVGVVGIDYALANGWITLG